MIHGIFPVIPTCFTVEDELDLNSQARVIRFALDCGAHGVVFPGVASEYNFLSPSERGELIAFVVKEVGGAVPIVGGASASSTDAAIAAGTRAMENGIEHLMIMAPSGLEKNLAAHQEFFGEISASLPGAKNHSSECSNSHRRRA